MKDKKVGFSTTPSPQGRPERDYFDVVLPEKTIESMDMEKGDLVHVEARSMDNKKVQFNRKLQEKGRFLKFYFPKEYADELGMSKESLLDVFISKP